MTPPQDRASNLDYSTQRRTPAPNRVSVVREDLADSFPGSVVVWRGNHTSWRGVTELQDSAQGVCYLAPPSVSYRGAHSNAELHPRVRKRRDSKRAVLMPARIRWQGIAFQGPSRAPPEGGCWLTQAERDEQMQRSRIKPPSTGERWAYVLTTIALGANHGRWL